MDSAQKPKQNNPFAGYNTVAYVPPRGEGVTNVSGNVPGSMHADAGSAGTTTNENASQTRGEAPETSLQPQTVSNSSLNQKPLETPENGPKTQGNEKSSKKSSRKWLIAVAVVVVLAAIGGVVAWFLLNKQPASEQGAIDVDDELVALDINDGLVQELYGRFTNERVWSGLLRGGELGDDILLNVAYANVKPMVCRGTHDGIVSFGEQGEELCHDGWAMRDKVNEIFGKTVEIDDGYGLSVWYCTVYTYDSLNDEFWPSGGGCSGTFTVLQRALTGAKKEGDRLYLYEVAAYSKLVAADREDDYMDWGYQGPVEARFYRLEKMSDQSGTWYQPGKRIDGLALTEEQLPPEKSLSTDNYAEVYLREYKDQLDTYKWTFVKDTNGNYIFEKLEKVEE